MFSSVISAQTFLSKFQGHWVELTSDLVFLFVALVCLALTAILALNFIWFYIFKWRDKQHGK